MEDLRTMEEAQERLRVAINAAGNLTTFCERVGVARGHVSRMRSGRVPVTGKVAEYLGLVPVLRYLEKVNNLDPRQEQYENQRRKHREQNGLPVERMKSVRG